MAKKNKVKNEVNDGYIHPMVCGSCLKVWVDNSGAGLGDVEFVAMFGQDVPVRGCPRCNFEASR